MKLAYFSPMPPEQTGIADYSALLLPPLRERIDVGGRSGLPAGRTSRSTTSGTILTRTRGSSTHCVASQESSFSTTSFSTISYRA